MAICAYGRYEKGMEFKMKKIDKFILVIFAIIVLAISLIIDLVMVGWINYSQLTNFVWKVLSDNSINQIILLVTLILIILAIKALFWTSSSKKKEVKSGRDILMQNDNGKLMISMETLENLANSALAQFDSIQQVKTGIMVDGENNVSVLVNLTVLKDIVIKDLTLQIQNKIKETIKSASDLEVKEVDVRIKNIVSIPESENKE